MSAREEFIEIVEKLFEENEDVVTDSARGYFNSYKITSKASEKEKPILTEKGKMILEWMQIHQDQDRVSSKEIAEDMGYASRAISGSFRKLVEDNFVRKVGENPSLYSITDKGINFKI